MEEKIIAEQASESITRELEALKAEKAQRERLDTARAKLRERGIPDDFAAYINGADEDEISQRVELFERSFSDYVEKRVASLAQQSEPQDFSQTAKSSPRRGIRRI